MKSLTIVMFVALFGAAVMSAPEGTRDNPVKITAADAMRAPKHHRLPHHENESVDKPAVGGADAGEGRDEPSATHESKRLRRSLKAISKAIHGVPDKKLVAIPISHGVKSAGAVKAGASVKASAGLLPPSLKHLPVVAAVLKGAKLAAPVVKPVVVTAHFAGKLLSHKVHKIVDHKLSKLPIF